MPKTDIFPETLNEVYRLADILRLQEQSVAHPSSRMENFGPDPVT